MISVVTNILIVVAILGFLIFIHELGHFLAAKLVNIRVDEFSLGFGPKIFSRKLGEVEFSIRVFPIGGFVNMLGENGGDSERNDPRNFQNKSVLARMFVLVAGVAMNLVFALSVYQYFLFTLGYKWVITADLKSYSITGGDIGLEKVGELKYEGIVEGSSASKVGMPENGLISEVDGRKIDYSYEFRDYVSKHSGKKVVLKVCTDEVLCQDFDVTVSKEGKVGIYLSDNYRMYWDYRGVKPFAGMFHALNMITISYEKLGELFNEAKETGDYTKVSSSVSGPIGVYVIVDIFKEYGFSSLLSFTSDLSLTLAVMNLLPIPALDGGRILLVFIEFVRGKPLNRKVEDFIVSTSFVLLLLLMIIVMFKDIFFFDSIRDMFK